MKITRKQLQKVISEEVRSYVKNKILSEGKVTNETIKVTADDLKRIIAEEVSKAKSNRLFEAKDLETLAKSDDVKDRCKAAEDPNLPEELIRHLSKDKEKEVRDCIARRKKTNESRNLVKATPGMLKRIIAEEARKIRR